MSQNVERNVRWMLRFQWTIWWCLDELLTAASLSDPPLGLRSLNDAILFNGVTITGAGMPTRCHCLIFRPLSVIFIVLEVYIHIFDSPTPPNPHHPPHLFGVC